MARLRPGLPLEERIRMRTGIAERLIRRALEQSSVTDRSAECREAMQLTGRQLADPEAAARAHKSCTAEEPDGQGCLCECHDVVLKPVQGISLAHAAVLTGSEEIFSGRDDLRDLPVVQGRFEGDLFG